MTEQQIPTVSTLPQLRLIRAKNSALIDFVTPMIRHDPDMPLATTIELMKADATSERRNQYVAGLVNADSGVPVGYIAMSAIVLANQSVIGWLNDIFVDPSYVRDLRVKLSSKMLGVATEWLMTVGATEYRYELNERTKIVDEIRESQEHVVLRRVSLVRLDDVEIKIDATPNEVTNESVRNGYEVDSEQRTEVDPGQVQAVPVLESRTDG